MIEISEEDLKYYRAEANSMKGLMAPFYFEIHNFETDAQFYEARHRANGLVVGVGKIPAEAVMDWIEKMAKANEVLRIEAEALRSDQLRTSYIASLAIDALNRINGTPTEYAKDKKHKPIADRQESPFLRGES